MTRRKADGGDKLEELTGKVWKLFCHTLFGANILAVLPYLLSLTWHIDGGAFWRGFLMLFPFLGRASQVMALTAVFMLFAAFKRERGQQSIAVEILAFALNAYALLLIMFLGFRLIKSTIQQLLPGRQRRGSFSRVCHIG